MKRHAYLVLALAAVAAVSGCHTFSGAPRIVQAAITPPELKPGDSALISVEVKDRHRLVDAVQGVVKEEPRITFKLRDDGEQKDAKANDGVWSLWVDVPLTAPPGDFMLEFTAYRKDGTPVPIRDKQGHVIPLTATLPLVIRYAAPQ